MDGQLLSELGTIIPLEKGPVNDEFFLTFEQLAGHLNVYTEPAVLPPVEPADLPSAPEIGLRLFEEIDASMSVLTGVSRAQSEVQTTYETIKQQLPSSENINGFLSAHQVGVSQLAIGYCSALVDDPTLRAGYFPGFDFSTSYTSAFASNTARDQIIDPLLLRMMGSGLAVQPDELVVKTELNALIDKLSICLENCDDRTATVVKATCAAVLGSAVMLIQ